MSGGAVVIIIDPNAPRRTVEETAEAERAGLLLSPYAEAVAAIDAAQAEGRTVRIVGV
jgi:hypothetical protein